MKIEILYLFSEWYSGILTSMLVLPSYEKPIDSLEDTIAAAEKGTHIIGTVYDTNLHHLFKVIFSKIFEKVLAQF